MTLSSKKDFDNLSGKILIAAPHANIGDVFHKSLIYVLSHTNEGAIGLMINNMVNQVPFKTLLKISDEANTLADELIPIYIGGPVGLDKCFFLHSSDYDKNLLFKFKEDMAISSNPKILLDMLAGIGPEHSLLVVGYSGWGAMQLETEIQNHHWIISDCDRDLIFLKSNEDKWSKALSRIGLDHTNLSSQYGLA